MLTGDMAPGGRPNFAAVRGIVDPRDDAKPLPACGDCGKALRPPERETGYCEPCWRGEAEKGCRACGYVVCECSSRATQAMARECVDRIVQRMLESLPPPPPFAWELFR